MKLSFDTKKYLSYVPEKYREKVREKAISRARTRIVLAGRDPRDFSPEDLEVVVLEEEEKIKGELKEKGLIAALALLGINLF